MNGNDTAISFAASLADPTLVSSAEGDRDDTERVRRYLLGKGAAEGDRDDTERVRRYLLGKGATKGSARVVPRGAKTSRGVTKSAASGRFVSKARSARSNRSSD
ncbi:hypothetical protein GXB85_13425 [Cellulomonas sp. APG4]|uniref:hypothetical protein n=1 Tax=Cellulomonas sp. APG4 TaxID=1538656 RepID=UPI00137B7E30|nr:hypothetical protein [Cellulomonas sp. APG4]NCT91943.1 hypothetical protein [Cellulomonas sp. APG4]